jgi:Concanavalin A-like lectin/glucanases superfamily/Secretion system C-terminal sorting domain
VYDPTYNFGKLVSKHTDASNVNYSLMPVTCEITTTNGYVNTPAVCNISLDKTYHVAMVYDGSSLKFYRNGFLMSAVPWTGNLVTNDLLTTIGSGPGFPGAAFQNFGFINEVRIWNVARTQAQIQAFMNSSLPGPTTQTGLLGYYTFDNLINKQGNAAYNGSITGSASINQTNPNCAFVADSCAVPCTNWLSLPSQGSAVTVGDLDVTGNQLTVEANFNRTAPLNSGIYYGHLVSKHTGAADANYALLPNGCEITTTGTGYTSTFQTCVPSLNKTYHVAMVYDGAFLKFYRNGFLMSQTPCTGNMVVNNLQTTIAQYAGGGLPFNNQFLGYVNEVRIWNVARTQAQIRSYMNASLPSPATQTGLLGYYTFDNLQNKQGNAAYNGTAIGSSTSFNETNPNCTFALDSCGIVIPVTITAFTATVIDNKKVKLAWKTEEESGMKEYIVERSENPARGFVPIAVVQARNNSRPGSYTVTDASVKPNVLYYYRLAMIENTGEKKYSQTRTAKITSSGFYASVYPNPTDGLVYVETGYIKTDIAVTMINGAGQVVLRKNLNTGASGRFTVDMGSLATGSYRMVIKTSSGKVTECIIKL